MGLFDHLFKSKSPAGEEKVVEPAAEGSAKPASTDGGPRTPAPQKADPSAFLHPKNFVPRGAPGLTPAPRPASSGISKPPADRKPPVSTPPAADEIVLTLGDVLSRIPTDYLKPGAHDPKRELRFKINDLSSDIARGRAAVPLSRITQLAPEIFARQVGLHEDMEIRLPLQKLVEQIGLLRSRPKATAIIEKVTPVERVINPMVTAEVPPSAKPVVPIEVKVEPKRVEPVAVPPVPVVPSTRPVVVPTGTEKVVRVVVPPPPQVPSIVLAEPITAKPVDLKPAAEPAAATPVVLGPPPVVERPVIVEPPPRVEIPPVAVVPAPPVPATTPAPVPAPVSPPTPPAPPVVQVKEIAKPIEPPRIVPEAKEIAAPLAPVVPVISVTPAPEPPVTVAAVPVAPPVAPVTEPVASVRPIPAVPPPVPEPPAEAVPPPPPHPLFPPPKIPSEPIHVDVLPPSTPEPQKIVIDWGADVPAKVEEKPGASVPEIEIEALHIEPIVAKSVVSEPVVAKPVVSEPATEGPKLAPIESPDLDTDEEKIHLSLAAILKHCPREIVVGQLPQVDDSVRITLPFAPIDRQLVKGHVEISALRFIVALPEIYHKYFVAKIGVKVPIPLEEVFQNLPSPKQELTPVNPTPPPVVLAPAAPAVPAAEVTPVPKPEDLGILRVAPIVPLPPSAAEEPEPEETPAPVEARTVEPPISTATVEPPPLPVVIPQEPIKVEVPTVPVPAAAKAEAVAPAAVVEPILPAADLPERLTAERAAQPPVPTIAEVAPPAAEPPPIPAVAAAAIPEPLPAAPSTESAPPPLPIPLGAANAAPTGDESPKLVLQRPVFRPHLIPPPPIFGFAPPPVAPEPEQPAKVEPPSVLAGLSESPAPAPATAVAEIKAVAVPETAASLKAEAPAATPADSEPSAELIALAGEHGAPDIAHFSGEPVPFADLAESLAHETTYAPALAEVVRVDVPDAEPAKPKVPVATSTEAPATEPAAAEKPAADMEHRAVPIVEGLAVAAVAATIAEHVPLNFREEVPASAEPAPTAEPTVAAESPKTDEMPTPATPAVPAPESPAGAVLPPPPHPLFPLPKIPAEPVHVEVLPPPALPLRRFDQDAVQALFMTEETLDLPKISHLAAALPGVYACVIATRDQACTGGTLPEGFDLAALLGLAPRVGEAAGRMPIGQLKHFTLYGDAYSVSFFERNGLSLCAVHRPRSFVPGVREKLVALADELSR